MMQIDFSDRVHDLIEASPGSRDTFISALLKDKEVLSRLDQGAVIAADWTRSTDATEGRDHKPISTFIRQLGDSEDCYIGAIGYLSTLSPWERGDLCEVLARELVERFSRGARGWFLLGQVLLMADKVGEAEWAFLRSVEIEPLPITYRTLIDGLRLRGKQEAALRVGAEASARFPDDATILFAYGVALSESFQFDRAFQSLERALCLGYEPTEVYWEIASAAFTAGNREKLAWVRENLSASAAVFPSVCLLVSLVERGVEEGVGRLRELEFKRITEEQRESVAILVFYYLKENPNEQLFQEIAQKVFAHRLFSERVLFWLREKRRPMSRWLYDYQILCGLTLQGATVADGPEVERLRLLPIHVLAPSKEEGKRLALEFLRQADPECLAEVARITRCSGWFSPRRGYPGVWWYPVALGTS